MKTISAKTRNTDETTTESLREKGEIPCVLYGPKIDSLSLAINQKEFKKLYKEVGETTLVKIKFDEEEKKVLIHAIQRHPISGNIIHIDFYQPSLREKTSAQVPLVFVGKSPAVEDESGTLIKAMDEVEVEALPQNLPHEIKVNISELKTFSDHIFVKNLDIPEKVEIKEKDDAIIASVQPPEDVEEELERLEEETIEEKMEEVEAGEGEEEGEEVLEEEGGEKEPEAGKEKEKKEEKEN